MVPTRRRKHGRVDFTGTPQRPTGLEDEGLVRPKERQRYGGALACRSALAPRPPTKHTCLPQPCPGATGRRGAASSAASLRRPAPADPSCPHSSGLNPAMSPQNRKPAAGPQRPATAASACPQSVSNVGELALRVGKDTPGTSHVLRPTRDELTFIDMKGRVAYARCLCLICSGSVYAGTDDMWTRRWMEGAPGAVAHGETPVCVPGPPRAQSLVRVPGSRRWARAGAAG